MTVVQAPVAQKVDNSFSTDKTLAGGQNLLLASSRLFKAWRALSSQLFSRYPADKAVHSKVGFVTFIH